MKLLQGDCKEKLKELEDNSIDAIVTDPPYELGFMGAKWDSTGIANDPTMWAECLRVLKPGGYLLSFGGTRTYHRMAVAIEDARFEIRDMIAWCYGQGFPKSLNVQKQLQKMGSERADEFAGVGTSLKPSIEPICMARKPLSEKTVAKNVLKWGTGGIDIDGSRVETGDNRARKNKTEPGFCGGWGAKDTENNILGRFPANLIHDNSEEVRECFPESKSTANVRHNKASENTCMSGENLGHTSYGHNDSGNTSRFFKSIVYQAKASKAERNRGLPDGQTSTHPTIKPIALMEYLIKMVSKEGAFILDPFMGSGSTGVAAKQCNRNFIGIEMEPEYIEIAKARIDNFDI